MIIIYTLLLLSKDKNGIFVKFYFIASSEEERVEKLIAEVFLPPSSNNLRRLEQEHDEAIRPSKSRQLIFSGIVNLFLSSWRRLIEWTFNINITSRKNCVTVKRAPRDKTICWTPRVIIHVGDTDARSWYRFCWNDQSNASTPSPQIFSELPNEIRLRKNSDYRANLRLRLDPELSHQTFIWTIKYLVSHQLRKSRIGIGRRASHGEKEF